MPTPVAGVELGAALAHEDVAGDDRFTAEALHAEALGVGIAPVTSGPAALLGSEKLEVELNMTTVAPLHAGYTGSRAGRATRYQRQRGRVRYARSAGRVQAGSASNLVAL